MQLAGDYKGDVKRTDWFGSLDGHDALGERSQAGAVLRRHTELVGRVLGQTADNIAIRLGLAGTQPVEGRLFTVLHHVVGDRRPPVVPWSGPRQLDQVPLSLLHLRDSRLTRLVCSTIIVIIIIIILFAKITHT